MTFWIICSWSSVQNSFFGHVCSIFDHSHLVQIFWPNVDPRLLNTFYNSIAVKGVWCGLNSFAKALGICTFSIRFTKIMIIPGIVALDTRGIWKVKIKSWVDFSTLNYYLIMSLLKNNKLQYDISVLQGNAVQNQLKKN